MVQTSSRYTKTAIILHWLIAIFIVVMFILGWFMADIPKDAPKQMAYDIFDLGIYTWQLSEEASPRTFYFNLHKSFATKLVGSACKALCSLLSLTNDFSVFESICM